VKCVFQTSDGLQDRWLGSLVAMELDLRLDGREFDFGRVNHLGYFTKPPRPTQPPTLRDTGNEYRPKCGDALRLRSKGRMVHFICGWTCGWHVKLCDPSLTFSNLSALEIAHVIKRYTNVLLTLLYSASSVRLSLCANRQSPPDSIYRARDSCVARSLLPGISDTIYTRDATGPWACVLDRLTSRVNDRTSYGSSNHISAPRQLQAGRDARK